MVHLKIDSIDISVPEGTTVLEAAKTVGISIPSMCYKEGFDNCPSCMVCMVKDRKSGNLTSSCALKVAEGMDLISDDPEVKESRKEALELLLSDHIGDCEAPCSLACPAGMNIPVMNRLIATGQYADSLKVVKEDIALPYVLGYICPAPCEKACRRKQVDEAVSVCILKRFVAADDQKYGKNQLPEKSKDSGKKVVIVGTGPAGLAAAYYLLQKGHQVVLFDKNEEPGGALRYAIPAEELPREVIDTEVNLIRSYGAEFRMNTPVTDEMLNSGFKTAFDAIIIATGDIASSGQFAGLVYGKAGIQAEDGTFETPQPGVFACGSVIRSQKMAVRAVAQGKSAALSVDLYLQGKKAVKPQKRFNSRFDKLQEPEFDEYLKESTKDKRFLPVDGYLAGFQEEEAINEAKRCLHCDCRKLDNCKLRLYADEYQADRKTFLIADRRLLTKHVQHDLVVYEPEKCIRCGICVEITVHEKELTGLSFVGRGFDVRVNVPFSGTIKEGLTHTAKKCVEACPTGALAFK